MARAVRYQTYNWKILGSNPAALSISFLRKLSQVIRENKDTILHFTKYTHFKFIFACLLTQMKLLRCLLYTQLVFALSFCLWYLLGKLHNLITQSDFKLAGPVLTHNLNWHSFFRDRLWERLLQKSISVGNMSIRGCLEQNPMCNVHCSF